MSPDFLDMASALSDAGAEAAEEGYGGPLPSQEAWHDRGGTRWLSGSLSTRTCWSISVTRQSSGSRPRRRRGWRTCGVRGVRGVRVVSACGSCRSTTSRRLRSSTRRLECDILELAWPGPSRTGGGRDGGSRGRSRLPLAPGFHQPISPPAGGGDEVRGFRGEKVVDGRGWRSKAQAKAMVRGRGERVSRASKGEGLSMPLPSCPTPWGRPTLPCLPTHPAQGRHGCVAAFPSEVASPDSWRGRRFSFSRSPAVRRP